MTVKGFEKTDFRDIEAFDERTAVIMGVSEPAFILRTTDGGENWNPVFTDFSRGVFLDAMTFITDKNGYVVGDPLQNSFYLLQTRNRGKKWSRVSPDKLPVLAHGEAFFAASGTNITPVGNRNFCFVTGGSLSRMYLDGRFVALPFKTGPSSGAFSVSCRRNKNGPGLIVVTGGDYAIDSIPSATCFFSDDGGKTWEKPVSGPFGFRSCVTTVSRSTWVACGTNGVDLSADGAKNWKALSRDSYHVCMKAKKGKMVFLAGANGRIGKLPLE
jgi:photosystem II stability/assembly factor-like uncharacterized protein